MNLRQRSYQAELLDQDNLSFRDLLRNMKELEFINRWLGGHQITLEGFRKLLAAAPVTRPVTICEIGCGGGDNLAAITQWADRNGIAVHCTGIDMKHACTTIAAKKKALHHRSSWITDDYRNVMFSTKPDIIFSSLFCHHFTEAALVTQLQWMRGNSRRGFFINDLHRHLVAYTSIRTLTRLLPCSHLLKNDAPLSVARGLKRREWQALLEQAGITRYSIGWRWAFRYLITYAHEPGPSI